MKILQIAVLATVCLATACSGQSSHKVASLQKKDKTLSCKEVMLEINEAEFYRRTAEKNKAPGVKSLIMPVGYISTYMNAEEAVDSANARVEYLNRIYEILDCDNPQAQRIIQSQFQQQQILPQPAPSVYAPSYPAGGVAQPSGYVPGMAAAPQVFYPAPQQVYHQPPTQGNIYW